jgi:hypothetical protein
MPSTKYTDHSFVFVFLSLSFFHSCHFKQTNVGRSACDVNMAEKRDRYFYSEFKLHLPLKKRRFVGQIQFFRLIYLQNVPFTSLQKT